jgi:integrase
MAREINRLNPKQVEALTDRGRHADGGGLYLCIGPGASRRWAFIFRWQGKLREMGLGSAKPKMVSLADARRKAGEARRMVDQGINPIEARETEAKAREADSTNFGAFADEWFKGIEPGFRNTKHAAQWRMTLTTYAAPLRSVKLADIGADHVLKVLQPLWQSRPETASRLRGRIERVLDAARVKGLRQGENPARWRGHLDTLLPKPAKLRRGHHKALAYAEVPAFIASLRASESLSSFALEFLVLTAARTGEVLGATWSEFDLDGKLWTLPAARMKAGRAHRVPLTPRALDILRTVEKVRCGDHVFPGLRRTKPLSNMALAMALRRLGLDDVTVHGFRSAFRDWCGNETAFPREVAEAALAHVIGDAAERAYRRDDALDKRRKLMAAWARFVEPKGEGNVIPIGKARRGPYRRETEAGFFEHQKEPGGAAPES